MTATDEENEINALRAMVEKLQLDKAKLRAALKCQRIGFGCFCDVSLGDPRMTSHTIYCELAEKTLEETQ